MADEDRPRSYALTARLDRLDRELSRLAEERPPAPPKPEPEPAPAPPPPSPPPRPPVPQPPTEAPQPVTAV